MESPPLRNIRAVVFDAYGTLFDPGSAAALCRELLGEVADPFAEMWRQKQLEYTWLRSLMRRHADFRQVTGEALDYAMYAFRLSDETLHTRLMEAYMELQAYPDVREALRVLRGLDLPSAILSNGAPPMLTAAIGAAGLDGAFAAVLSAEDAGVFKPDPRVYALATDRLGLEPLDVAFVSANAWDVAGAASYGFRAVWLNRAGRPRERLPYGPVAELRSLAELPPML